MKTQKLTQSFSILFYTINSNDNHYKSWKLQERLPASYEDIWECPIITHLFSTKSIVKSGNKVNILGFISQNWIKKW